MHVEHAREIKISQRGEGWLDDSVKKLRGNYTMVQIPQYVKNGTNK
jgi:hypothetical protein